MSVPETSIESYRKLSPELGLRQRQVLIALARRDLTNFQLSKILNLPINSITGRVNELASFGLVVKRGTVFCNETKRNVTLWGIPLEGNQLGLF